MSNIILSNYNTRVTTCRLKYRIVDPKKTHFHILGSITQSYITHSLSHILIF